MMSSSISQRSSETIASLDKPWRFAPTQTYDAEKNPSGMISFGSATNWLVRDKVFEFAEKHMHPSPKDLVSSGNFDEGTRAHKAMAMHMNEYFEPHTTIQPENVRIAAGATSIHETLSWVLCDRGEGILTSAPVYGRFEIDFGNRAEVKLIYAETDPVTSFEENVVESFEEALQRAKKEGTKIKAVAIVNPHNPLGRCYPKQTLVNIMKFCQKHQLHLMSDEIYACTTFESGEPDTYPFTSVLSIDPTDLIDPNLVHAEYGLSKDFGIAGLRLGAIATHNKKVLEAMDTVLRFCETSTPSLNLARTILEDREFTHTLLSTLKERLSIAYKQVTSDLNDNGIEYLAGGNAGFFVYVNLSKYLPENLNGEENSEFALAKKLMDAGVFLHPREENCPWPGWFRLVYTQQASIVSEGVRRIKAAITA